MNIVVNQTITIHNLKVGGISNSSILQIGTAGVIKAVSYLSNSGNFKGPAPELKSPIRPLIPFPPPNLDHNANSS